MYFAEVVKMLKVAVAVFSVLILPLKAESPPIVSKETLEARLAVIVHKEAEIEGVEQKFRAWVEATKPKEGEEPSEQHKLLLKDHEEVMKQLASLIRVRGFLMRKITNHMSPGELAIANNFMTNVETAIEQLNLPIPPTGEPRVIAPIEKIEVLPLPPIVKEEEREQVPAKAEVVAGERVPDEKVIPAPVIVEREPLVEQDEALRRAKIAADVEARLKLLEEKGGGIAPIIIKKGHETVLPAPYKATSVAAEESLSPVVVEEKVVPKLTDTSVIPEVVEKAPEESSAESGFTLTEPVPREDGTEKVIVKTNLGAGYDPEKVQYVELNCSTALLVKREPNPSSENIDDITCKNDNGNPTKVLVLGFKDGHFKVFVNGSLGWISAVKTSEVKEVGVEDERDTTMAVRPQDGQLKCDTRLMHRGGPSKSYRILQKIPCKTNGRPTPVKIIGKHNETGWYLISHNNTVAWSSNRYITASEPDNLQVVTDELIQGLAEVPDLGDLGIKCDPNGTENDDPNCVRFQADFYTKGDAAKQIAAAINQAKQRGVRAKKEQFFELFAPIAIFIQTKTGWPASVALAQMAIETNWGTSNVFRNLNNFGGHSCTRYNQNDSRPLRNTHLIRAGRDPNLELPGLFQSSSGDYRIKSPCTYPRPRNEGHYYRNFSSVADAAFLYADNVLESSYYPNASRHVKDRFAAGQKADPETVVQGLRPYAQDPGYRNSLMSIIRSNNLTRFDDLKSCPLTARN